MATHVFETMGTTLSLAFRGGLPADGVLDRVHAIFRAWDDRYSLYRPSSELSRIARGEISLMRASAGLRQTYELAMEWRSRTGGAFTPHRPDGVIDLSGVVKALAMGDAGGVLAAAGSDGWAINVGGDVLVSPTSQPASLPEPQWTIGIVDPVDRRGLLTSVALTGTRRACATSGVAERGEHIWRTDRADTFVQVTVLADDIVTADVLATAMIAGGEEALDQACRSWPIDVITVDSTGEVRMTPGAVDAMQLADRNMVTAR